MSVGVPSQSSIPGELVLGGSGHLQACGHEVKSYLTSSSELRRISVMSGCQVRLAGALCQQIGAMTGCNILDFKSGQDVPCTYGRLGRPSKVCYENAGLDNRQLARQGCAIWVSCHSMACIADKIRTGKVAHESLCSAQWGRHVYVRITPGPSI